MELIEQYTQTIKQRYPELAIGSVVINQEGQYNDVLIYDDTLVFRFAKVPDAVKTLKNEVVVQKCLRDHLPLQIPDPIYTNIDSGIIGETFVGYRKIKGKPLWRDNFHGITDQIALGRMARQLAGFLQALHQVDVEGIIPISLPNKETRGEWADLYERIQTALYPHMCKDARRDVSEHFEGYLGQTGRCGFEPRLRHGDFGTGNIIYNPVDLSIAGIVDFGGVGLGDPAVDFAGLYISYGSDFYQDCCAVNPQMGLALDRVHFYCGTFALQEALFGVENNDEKAFHAGIANYR